PGRACPLHVYLSPEMRVIIILGSDALRWSRTCWETRMGSCKTEEFFEEICGLLQALGNEQLLLKDEEISRVTELVQRWQSIECPGGGCMMPCPYARPNVYWIESLGY